MVLPLPYYSIVDPYHNESGSFEIKVTRFFIWILLPIQ
jgi:hypothetical protein